MTGWAEFITARLGEYEALAKAAPAGPWWISDTGIPDRYPQVIVSAANILIAETFTGPQAPPAEAAHIAANDPAFTLAWVAAMREIVASECSPYPKAFPPATLTMRLIASIWAGHPDYPEAGT